MVGYEGFYSVSDQGRVRSEPRAVSCGRGAVRRAGGHLLKPHRVGQTKTSVGYWTVGFYVEGKRKGMSVHVLVAEAFLCPRPPGLQCCHKNGNGLDNRPVNLRWGTASENILDSVRHGTHPRTRRQYCPLGHALTAPNLNPAQLRRGWRSCRSCDLADVAIRRRRRRGERGAVLDRRLEADCRYAEIMASDGPS